MLTTGIGAEAAEPYLARVTDGEALLACKNSPSSTTISGDLTAVNQLEGMLKTDGHFARRLLVSTAYHSPHMRVIADLHHNSIKAYESTLEDDSSIKMFSSVTGQLIKSQDLRPSYWVSNMVHPVEFDPVTSSSCSPPAPVSPAPAASPTTRPAPPTRTHWPQHRRAQGQHGSVIDLGVVLDVGYVAENTSQEVQDNTKKWSFVALCEKEVHALVQAAITGESIKGQPVPTQIITGLGTGGMANLAGFQIPWWLSDAKFAHLRDIDTHQVTLAPEEDTLRLQTLLAQATSFDGAADVVSSVLVQKLSKALTVDVEDIETTKPLSRYGFDSLLAVEVRTWIFMELQADISVFQLLSNVPLSQLARDITVKSKAVPAAVQQAEAATAAV